MTAHDLTHVGPRLRRDLPMILASGHLSLALLGIAGRLEYAVSPRSDLIARVADSWVWAPAHAAAGLVLLGAIGWRPAWRRATASLSTGTWGAWGLLTLLWALDAEPPVTLVPPVLGLSLAAVAWRVSATWEDSSDDGGT